MLNPRIPFLGPLKQKSRYPFGGSQVLRATENRATQGLRIPSAVQSREGKMTTNPAPAPAPATTGDAPSSIPPNRTIYINNLNEKIKLEALKKELQQIFSQFGKILEILAFKTLKHKGQAWVVFEEVSQAAEALKGMQGFPFHDKPMRIQYAKTKSDIIAKADGTFVPRERRKRHDDRAERKRREQHHEANLAASLGSGYAAGYGGIPPLSQLPYPGAKSLPEAPAPPNNILFVQNLPLETTSMMLQMLFGQYPGFKEVRMVDAKPGIAFVEYHNEMQSTVAMQNLQQFQISRENTMVISYAKK